MALVSNHSCFEMVMLAGKYTVCDLDRFGHLRIVVPAHPTGLFDLSTASWTMVAVTGSDWQCNQPSSAIWTCTNMMWIGILIGSSSIKLAESTFELPFIWVIDNYKRWISSLTSASWWLMWDCWSNACLRQALHPVYPLTRSKSKHGKHLETRWKQTQEGDRQTQNTPPCWHPSVLINFPVSWLDHGGSDWQCNQPSSAIWTCTNMMWIGILIGSSSIKLAESTFELPFIWVNWQLQEMDFFIDISLMMTHVGLLKQRLLASGFAPCLSPHTEQE